MHILCIVKGENKMRKKVPDSERIIHPDTGEVSYPFLDKKGNVVTKDGYICETEEEELEVVRDMFPITRIYI